MRVNIAFLLKTALSAGEEILRYYDTDFSVERKSDGSPLTLADRASHKIIMNSLSGRYPSIPLLSEEGREIPFEERSRWETFWLVDPLDGTKEFIKKNGEFTVNIALIQNGMPILGIIYIPVRGIFYYAVKGSGAYRFRWSEVIESLVDAEDSLMIGGPVDDLFREVAAVSERLPIEKIVSRPFTIIGSRSHATEELDDFVERMKASHGRVEFLSAGSSLKFCLIAEGKADIYPRYGPTMEWDTAAGQIIVEEAGGEVVEINTGRPLRYNKENLLNPWFIVRR
jgi:3'(2'), 5'-bisphosphate nucleotidase